MPRSQILVVQRLFNAADEYGNEQDGTPLKTIARRMERRIYRRRIMLEVPR